MSGRVITDQRCPLTHASTPVKNFAHILANPPFPKLHCTFTHILERRRMPTNGFSVFQTTKKREKPVPEVAVGAKNISTVQ